MYKEKQVVAMKIKFVELTPEMEKEIMNPLLGAAALVQPLMRSVLLLLLAVAVSNLRYLTKRMESFARLLIK